MAETSLYITIVLIIATLNITKARNASGEEITPEYRMSDTLIRSVHVLSFFTIYFNFHSTSYSDLLLFRNSHPVPFTCHIAPRTKKASVLIYAANEEQPFEKGDGMYLSDRIREKYKSV